jgi:hypothetical protein
MSYPTNGDFEVMPVGTMEELKVLRAFANDMIAASKNHENPTAKWDEVSPMINQLQSFYYYHNEKYPVIV